MADSDPFSFLKSTNDWLESVPLRAIEGLDNSIVRGGQMTQEKVDAICEWLSWKINVSVERVRQACLKSLNGLYQNTVAGKVMQAANTISNFVKDPIGTIFGFASMIFGPVPKVLSWLKTLMKEIPRLAKNLAAIVSALPPDPPIPTINYNKFKVKVKTIDLQTIIKGPDSLPPPEVMYPEPPKPFSKETFEDIFANANAKLKSNKLVYKLTDKQKNSLKVISIDSLADNSLDSLSFNS